VDALCDAWSIFTDNQRAFLRRIGQMPGGLRGATFVIELAQMMAGAERQDLQLSHLQDAWAQLSSRQVAA
jgi:glutamine synthetase adenylyltransferase